MLSYKSNEEIMKDLGIRLKDIRIGYNYTQQELAKRACVSLSTVSRIEKGENVSVDQLLSIFRELHLIDKLNDFIPRQEPTPIQIYENQKKRKRVKKKQITTDWKWGDEE